MQPSWFKDITEESGARFLHSPGVATNFFMPEMVGSGVALLDFDNDGRLDLYFIQNAGPNSQAKNQLFHQGTDGRFTDVSSGSGLDVSGYGMGVAVGDVNNDGLPDVLITEYDRARLFLNKGSGKFTDITSISGVDNPLWGISAGFVDYDRDGWLDLVIVNYVEYDPQKACEDKAGKKDYCGPTSFPGRVTRLYHNLGGSQSTHLGLKMSPPGQDWEG